MRIKLVAIFVAMLMFTGSIAYSVEPPEQEVFELINEERVNVGLPELVLDAQLSGVAEAWSDNMMAEQDLSHNPDKQHQVENWFSLGENVGRGVSIAGVHGSFMNSIDHRDNILNERWDTVGVGVAEGEQLWVTQLFVELPDQPLYTDDSNISIAHREAVYSLRERGLMTGFEDNSFKPQEPITREQFASILNDILENG